MVGSFLNLKRLEIRKCPMMEELVATGEGNSSAALKEVRFSKLETIILEELENMQTIWCCQLDTLKTLKVKICEKIVVLFPSSMQRTYHSLETLVVTDCASVQEIFELTSNETSNEEGTTQLKKLTLDGLPKLKQIWSRDPQGILNFHNLQDVYLKNCKNLEYLFPHSIATSCLHLKELIIKCCGVKEVVAKKEGSMCPTVIFEFHQLNSLVLWNLHKLKRFYAGNHTLACPSLRKIDVFGCAQLNLFETQSMCSQGTEGRTLDGKLHVPMQQPLFIIEEVIPKLEILSLNNKYASTILQVQLQGDLFSKLKNLLVYNFEDKHATFLYWLIQNRPILESLNIRFCSFKEIFREEKLLGEEGHEEGQTEISTQLKMLTLYQLPELQHISKEGSQIDPVLETLEYLNVDGCSGLIILVPSTVTFSHLTYLEIANCNGLINLITSPTARSLAKLTTMKIKQCNSLEEIMAEKGGETIYDIAFVRLQNLELECLPRLNRFCSSKCFLRFPLLENMVVRQCPRMEIFSEGNTSTPNLRKVKIAKNDEEWHWKGNLNGTIKNMFEDMVAFRSFELLKLSEYPELKELWYGELQHQVLSNLKYLVVHKCNFLLDILFQPNLLELFMNLEELDVRDCDSLEAVFDVKDKYDKEIQVKKCTQLKKLTLSGLPKLKHVWKEDPYETWSFQNLCVVFVKKCKSLKSLFPLSIATDMMQLHDLKVHSCGIEEIVAKEEGTKEIIKFVFPCLTSLDLMHLPKLKGLYSGIHTLECKSLNNINVFNCQKLELFKIRPMSCQERDADSQLQALMHQPLFTIREVIPNLEKLTLRNRDTILIMQSQVPKDLFCKLKLLRVSKFENNQDTFPYWILQNVPHLEWLVVEWGSFKEIFREERLGGKEGQINSIQLKKLTLRRLPELQHICKERSQIDPVLEVLETIYVDRCSSLTKLVPSSVTFSNLMCLVVTNCNGLVNLISSPTAKSLVKLRTLKIKDCNSLEEIVVGEGDEACNEIAFCSLEMLELVSLPRLSRFCSHKPLIMFPSMEKVVVRQCPRMEIFSLGDTTTPNLQKVQVEENNKEYYWEGDLNAIIKKMFVDMVAFRSFKHLKLSEYPELKDLWYGQHMDKIFCNLKSLVVQKCDFLSNFLFPSNSLAVLQKLEELEVRDCNSLEAIFDVKGMNEQEMMVKRTSPMRKLSLSCLPKLRHIWNKDSPEVISFGNLCIIEVVECQSLVNIFPLSLCQDLGHLEELNIVSCGVEEIIAMEEGSVETIKFEFPHLASLRLRHLPRLNGLYAGIHIFDCKSLKNINVFDCKKLELFKTGPMSCQERAVDCKLRLPIHQPLFTIQEVIPNLEELTLRNRDTNMIMQGQVPKDLFCKLKLLRVSKFENNQDTFPYWILQNVPHLEWLVVEWGSFKEIFREERLGGKEGQINSIQLKKLTLRRLPELQHICKERSQIDPVLEVLESIYVDRCSSLTKLVPSSVTFCNLMCLVVTNCNGLVNLISSPTAKCLVKLRTLKIKDCNSLEEIVIGEGDEAYNEIAFSSLEMLELVSLPRLSRFCSHKSLIMFPLMEKVVVRQCPRMEIFSLGDTTTPNLQKVQVEENNKEYYWEGDLNAIIKKMFVDMVAFRSFKHLTLSEYPELKDLWYGQHIDKIFCNLTSLVVQKCDFLSNFLFPSNSLAVLQKLEELEVRDCNSLEAIFDVKSMNENEMMVKRTSPMRKLSLSCLPKLRHIWNKDSPEVISFGNLCIIEVVECQSLVNIFPLSLCQDLGHLEELNIVSCGVEEIIAMEEGSAESSFNFPQLTKLRLITLTKLRNFYLGKHTLECPSLKILNIYRCAALQMFAFDHSDFRLPHQVDAIHDMSIRQVVFSIETVSPNLEELALNGKDAMMIFNGHCQENLFHKVEFLRLQCFDETLVTFLNDFLEIFPNLVTLQLRDSSFETLFTAEGISHRSAATPKKMRKLLLFELEQLTYIWLLEDSPLNQLAVQNLEEIRVTKCPSLISLVPSSISFGSLTKLCVHDCKGLIYLISTSTAQSLMQLKTLIIENCEMIEDVVKIGEGEAKEEIIFKNLEYLKFTALASLRSFCFGKHTFIFPSLVTLLVKGCPEMKIFSPGVIVAPFLTAVEEENGKKRWKDDLNTSIEQLFIDKIKASTLSSEDSSPKTSRGLEVSNPQLKLTVEEVSRPNENKDHHLFTSER